MDKVKKFYVYIDKTTMGDEIGTPYYAGKGSGSRGKPPRDGEKSKHDYIMKNMV